MISNSPIRNLLQRRVHVFSVTIIIIIYAIIGIHHDYHHHYYNYSIRHHLSLSYCYANDIMAIIRKTTSSSLPSSSSNVATMSKRKEYESSMTLLDKIAQMAQIDIHLLITTNNEIDDEKIELYFGKYGIGSLLITPLSPSSYLTTSEYRSIIIKIQNTTNVYNRPPVLVGIDSVHGANYIKNAIITPQQINIASTWNVTNAYSAGYIAGRDTRYAGIGWIFSPILGLGMESFWSRIYETFGEDPLIVGEMGKAMVRGIQYFNEDTTIVPSRSAACAKHFIGYSAPRTGHDRSPSWIPRRHLYQYFVKPWRDVLSNNHAYDGSQVYTVMESYTEYNGVPNVDNKESLQHLLREKLQFDGLLITDYQEVENLVSWHKTAKDITEAVKSTLTEGSVDMSMIPFDFYGWRDNVLKAMGLDPNHLDNEEQINTKDKNNMYAPFPQYPIRVDVARIDESVSRILDLKEKLHMFNENIVHHIDENLLLEVGSEEDRNAVLEMARESIILTKNDNNTLPIIAKSKNIKVHVTGPTSNSIRSQSGGWTIQWQGSTNDNIFSYGTTVLDAARNIPDWDVSSSCGVDILGNECSDETNMDIHQVDDSDYVIVCVGEEAYTEKPGDIRMLQLPDGQIEFVKQVKKATKRGKVILVYFGGRPRLLKDMVQNSDVILIAFLPGPDGGQAVVDLITGNYNPSGRLPITYPKYADKSGVPYWHAVSDMCTSPDDENSPLPHYQYTKCEVEWKFGHGLSYTNIVYSDIKFSGTKLTISKNNDFNASIKVTLRVKNTGNRSVSETIMLFIFVENRLVTPENKLLWHFEKVALDVGEEKKIQTELSIDHLRFIGPHDDTHMVIQPGMNVKIGVGPYVDCRVDNSDLCSDSISVIMKDGEQYEASCEAACSLWKKSDCIDVYNFSSDMCWEKCLSSDSSTTTVGW